MRRDAEVAPKCLLRSLVIRRKWILWKVRLRPNREEEEEEEEEEEGKEGREGTVIMVGCITA